jgi:hypothetical protein
VFFTENAVTFMAVYYDPSDVAPAAAMVNIGGQEYELDNTMGTPGKGVYTLEQTSVSYCRYYYFLFTDNSQTEWRYPESGFLATYGEGGCRTDYSTEISDGISGPLYRPAFGRVLSSGAGGALRIEAGRHRPMSVRITDVAGRRRGGDAVSILHSSSAYFVEISRAVTCLPGIICAEIKLPDGSERRLRIISIH